MSKTSFSSDLDEALVETIRKAAHLTGKAGATAPTGPAKREIVYEEGFKPLTAVFPISLRPGDINPAVRVFQDSDWPEELQKFIPKVDPLYVFDPEALVAIVAGIMLNDKILLHGPKGSGKTTLPQQICARIRMPWIRVNCRLDMESSALFGGHKYDPVQGLTFVEGPLPELARAGGMVCIDEVSRTPAGINAALMAILERNGQIYLADKPGASKDKFIEPHPWFRIVCTDNTELQGDTTGKYVGTNVQDEALIDRFNTTYRLDYLSPAHEMAIIMGKVKEIDNLTAQRMIQMAALIRVAYDKGNLGFTMSPRGLLEWAEKIAYWGNIGRAFKLSFFNKLTQTDAQVVSEMYHTVFSENLR